MQVEIVEAREFHCGRMVRQLRREHVAAITKLGVNSHRALREYFDNSAYRRALLIDGKLAMLGGVTGPAIAGNGTIWLALTQDATRHPHLIARICRQQLRQVLKIKRELDAFVLPADETSLRFAKMMGFVTLRNSPVDIGEGAPVPMVIRREENYTAAALH